jgi:hypothetical protein
MTGSFIEEPYRLKTGPAETFASADRLEHVPVPAIVPGLTLPTILGNGALISFTSRGGDVDKVFAFFSGEARQKPDDAGALLDLALLHLIQQRRDKAYRVQARALELAQIYRVVGTCGAEIPVRRRVLALVAPGDFMNNAQLEFLLDGSDIGLDVLYVLPGKPLPASVPEHDVLFCAVNESDENQAVLDRLAGLLPRWPRPVLNAPGKIAGLTRDGVASLFAGCSAICAPPVRRLKSDDVRRLAAGEVALNDLVPGASYPILSRPVGSHCGENFEKIASPEDLFSHLLPTGSEVTDHFLGSFADYRSADGQYRKYRVALIDGVPYLCHMAVCDEWKIHYINAGMDESADKRAEEALAMSTFDEGFAHRHRAAFAELCRIVGLDYFGIDCAELPDGRLLLFEAETAMVIHDMDSAELYPYKKVQMPRVFAAFRALVDRASDLAPGLVD